MVGNAHRAQAQGQRNRKQTADGLARKSEDQVRAKRWGKSPPRVRRRIRHGKPHPEKGHIEEDETDRKVGLTALPAPQTPG